MNTEALILACAVLIIGGALAMAWGRRTMNEAAGRIERALTEAVRAPSTTWTPSGESSVQHPVVREQSVEDALSPARRVN